MKKLFYIKERTNEQLSKPYYVAYGQLSKAEAKKKGSDTLYGHNQLMSFNTETAYLEKIAELGAEGFRVTKGII